MSSFFNGVTNEQLAEVGLLSGLDNTACDKIRERSYFIGAYPGLRIVRRDDTGFELYIILSGTADVVRDSEVVATLGKGDVFGEMALLGNTHRNADVVATSVMSMLSMTAADFRDLSADVPDLEHRIRDLAEKRASAG